MTLEQLELTVDYFNHGMRLIVDETDTWWSSARDGARQRPHRSRGV